MKSGFARTGSSGSRGPGSPAANSLLTGISSRSHAGCRYWRGAIRNLVVLCSFVALALVGSAAWASEPTSGTLSVERGKGVVMIDLRGSVLGRLTTGSLRVTDQTPFDRYAP